MNIFDILPFLPRIMPLTPRIDNALKTIQRLESDPAVKDAIAVMEELASILKQLPKGG